MINWTSSQQQMLFLVFALFSDLKNALYQITAVCFDKEQELVIAEYKLVTQLSSEQFVFRYHLERIYLRNNLDFWTTWPSHISELFLCCCFFLKKVCTLYCKIINFDRK